MEDFVFLTVLKLGGGYLVGSTRLLRWSAFINKFYKSIHHNVYFHNLHIKSLLTFINIVVVPVQSKVIGSSYENPVHLCLFESEFTHYYLYNLAI